MPYQIDRTTKKLFKAILALKTEDECKKFLRDLLTEAEIKEFANRWKVAQMLDKKIPYEDISTETGMSSTTIARISKWLTNGMGGYKFMLKRINNKQNNNHRHNVLKAV
jgi:TrpR-related protein YerC/YecD